MMAKQTCRLLIATFLWLISSSCQKTCKGDGEKRLTTITPAAWQWFNYPEGTRMAYENNLGDRDTVVFGATQLIEVVGYRDYRDCYTQYVQEITQDITWVHGMNGRVRPIALEARVDGSLSVIYSDGGESPYGDEVTTDSVFYQNKWYKNVILRCCGSAPCRIQCDEFSKTGFFFKISYLLPDNTLETWERK